ITLAGQLLEQVVRQFEEHAVDQVQVVVDTVGTADGEAPQVVLEFDRHLMARLQFDNDARRIHGTVAIPGSGFQRVVKMVVLDELPKVPWFLDWAMTNMPAVGRGDRWCNPE